MDKFYQIKVVWFPIAMPRTRPSLLHMQSMCSTPELYLELQVFLEYWSINIPMSSYSVKGS